MNPVSAKPAAPKRSGLFLLGMTAVVTLYYCLTQPQIEQSNGYGPDGTNYYHLFQYYRGEETVGKIHWPFNKRPGTPWLAAAVPLSPVRAFLAVNLTAGLLVVLFCYLALSRCLSQHAMWLCLVPPLCFLHGPLRYSFFYPFTADPPAIACYAAAAFFIVTEKYWWALTTLCLSCVFREQGVYYALAIGPMLWFKKVKTTRVAVVMTALALCGALLNHLVKYPNPVYSEVLHNNQLAVMLSFLKLRLATWEGMPVYLAAIGCTLGPFAFAAPSIFLRRMGPMSPATAVSGAWLLLSLGMAFLGGGEVARIFFIGFPLYAVFLGEMVKGFAPQVTLFFLASGLIANSFLSPLTVNLHEWWVPSVLDSLFQRSVPLPMAFLIYWTAIYGIYFFCFLRSKPPHASQV